jgi:diguanylate cyclase (GGDEF)-like protein
MNAEEQRRERAATLRDTDATLRDQHAGGRDSAAEERDLLAEERDLLADERDRAADERDQVAETRDRAATAREKAEIDRTVGMGELPEPTQSQTDRQAAATDRRHARADRRSGQAERRKSQTDRSLSSTQRVSGISDRAASESDRLTASADRGQSVTDQATAALDELTGVLLRGPGLVRLTALVQAARDGEESLQLAFLDVDHLKTVNDSLGHSAGDRLLRQVAETLSATLGPDALVLRYGGDEFVCATPRSSSEELDLLLRQVRERLRAGSESGSISFGTTGLLPSDTAESMMARADSALYDQRRSERWSDS